MAFVGCFVPLLYLARQIQTPPIWAYPLALLVVFQRTEGVKPDLP